MPNSEETRRTEYKHTEEGLVMPGERGAASQERRRKDRTHDTFYRVILILNLLSWGLLVGALFMFHYARPEFISGVQEYWGIEGRDFWSQSHLDNLLTLLQISLVTSLITFILHTRRSRRKGDSNGYNLLFLLVICVLSLVTIYTSV